MKRALAGAALLALLVPSARGAHEIGTGRPTGWTVPGRAGDQAFEIVGFLGWVPPEHEGGEGVPTVLLAGGALLLVALSAGAAFLLGRRTP